MTGGHPFKVCISTNFPKSLMGMMLSRSGRNIRGDKEGKEEVT